LAQPQDQAKAVFVGQTEVDNQYIMRAFEAHAFRAFRVRSCLDLVPSLSQRTLQEALNYDFIFN
jgi:hypothetical protein